MNNIKKNILILLFSTTLISCSQSATSVLKKDAIYAQNIQYSRIIKSIKDENINALINITYLNSSNRKKWNNGKQNFLIGTYVFENKETDFQVSMNNKNYISSTLITKDDPMYKNIAFRNNWAKYKVITFDNDKSNTLTIKYTHPKFKTISTTFDKE